MWDIIGSMTGGKGTLLHVDKKGRIHVPIRLREELGIGDQVLAEKRENVLMLQPMRKISDPLKFLCSINIKTKKTPVEMKREAENGFL